MDVTGVRISVPTTHTLKDILAQTLECLTSNLEDPVQFQAWGFLIHVYNTNMEDVVLFYMCTHCTLPA